MTQFFLDHFKPKLTQLYNAHVLLLEQNLQLLELNLDHSHPFQQHLSNGSNLQGRIDLDFKIYKINVGAGNSSTSITGYECQMLGEGQIS